MKAGAPLPATSAPPVLPDFLIIGAVKAATTWVTCQLQRHPGIFLPDPEPHYFSREFHRGPKWYASHFAAARPGQLRGEKTADYLANPDAAARIAAVLPDIPLILQLRDPVARAYSDYCMLFRRGTISGPPADYLDPATASFRRFIDNGLYFSHLRRWLDLFPRDQLLVFLFEDVKERPRAVLNACCRHLGVPALGERAAALDQPVNDGSAPYLPLALRRALAPVKGLVAPLRGNPLFQRTRAVLARPVAHPPLPPDLARRLRDFYAPEVAGLADLLRRNLDHWLNTERVAA